MFTHRLHRLWIAAPLLLAGQALLVNWIAGSERPPSAPDLTQFPQAFGEWTQVQEDPVGDAIQAELGADRILSRTYTTSSGHALASVFVAWFQSQRAGVRQPHSPKVCLPGAGWFPEETSEIKLDTSESGITVNRYLVTQKTSRAVVLYWYQTPRRVTSGEWESKFWIALDALRDHRTDTALVRVLAWSSMGKDNLATQNAAQLARDLFPILRKQLPGLPDASR